MSSIFFIHYRRCDIGSTFVLTFAYDYQFPRQICIYRCLCLSVRFRGVCNWAGDLFSFFFFSSQLSYSAVHFLYKNWINTWYFFENHEEVRLFYRSLNITTSELSFILDFPFDATSSCVLHAWFFSSVWSTVKNTTDMSINSTEVWCLHFKIKNKTV